MADFGSREGPHAERKRVLDGRIGWTSQRVRVSCARVLLSVVCWAIIYVIHARYCLLLCVWISVDVAAVFFCELLILALSIVTRSTCDCRSRRGSRAGMEEVEIDLGDEQQQQQQQQSDLPMVSEHGEGDGEEHGEHDTDMLGLSFVQCFALP